MPGAWKKRSTRVLALCGIAIAATASAQETRLAGEGHTPPPATLADVAWLAGQWSGTGIGGAPTQESWLPPIGDTMVGIFVQEDGEGAIRFTEHLHVVEEDNSLILRLKHFNADLTGWEEKDEVLDFRLVAVEPCAAYFHALTLRCDGEDGLLAAVRMKSKDDRINELVFRYRRIEPVSAPASADKPECPDAQTTPEINACFAAKLDEAEARRGRYFAAALDRKAGEDRVLAAMHAGQAAFEGYRDAECGAVLEDWIDGTIRTAMALSCRIALTEARTHDIWESWLTYMDTTPPDLPEPK